MTPTGAEWTVGVDLGGTKIHAALVDARGRVAASHRTGTDIEGGPSKAVADIVRCVHACAPDLAEVGAVGVGVAGQVDTKKGIVRSAPNLGWSDFPLGERLEQVLGVPVAVENDVRAISWGVWRHGAGRDVDDLLVLFVGTGVGGGIVSGGLPITGDRGVAGEIGHSTLVQGGRLCTCGRRGCLEAYAGGWAIAARAREAVAEDPEAGQAILDAAGKGEVTAVVVSQAAADGDPLAARLLDETARCLGSGLAGLVHVLNPRRIVLGGGVIDGNPHLVDIVESVVREQTIPIFSDRLEFRGSELGPQAGVIGAASLARRRLQERSAA
ncbi:MAG: ROK family protein [marine benthic group bacterium]|nr:ROK family protein [Candidatus Benthicola marisminoris]